MDLIERVRAEIAKCKQLGVEHDEHLAWEAACEEMEARLDALAAEEKDALEALEDWVKAEQVRVADWPGDIGYGRRRAYADTLAKLRELGGDDNASR